MLLCMQGLGAVLSQVQEDGKLHPVAFASRALTSAERNYSITELVTLAVVWALSHFHHHLYGNSVTILTDRAAVQAVLRSSNFSGKHARWWTRVYGRGICEVNISYRAGKKNKNADALSRSPTSSVSTVRIAEREVQVSAVKATSSGLTQVDLTLLLDHSTRGSDTKEHPDFASEQAEDPIVVELLDFIVHDRLPVDNGRARKMALLESLFTIMDGIFVLCQLQARES